MNSLEQNVSKKKPQKKIQIKTVEFIACHRIYHAIQLFLFKKISKKIEYYLILSINANIIELWPWMVIKTFQFYKKKTKTFSRIYLFENF